jgi:hypothetical protein
MVTRDFAAEDIAPEALERRIYDQWDGRPSHPRWVCG